jgi:L-aspartate oxidase
MSTQWEADYVVIGAGIAGLRAAVELADSGRVLVVTKEQLGESNTQYAQGGIAVAVSGEEDIALHLEDTKMAGDGLVDEAAAAILVREGPERVAELLAWGTNFDRYQSGDQSGELMLTREGAHSRNRILHANGDATGREISRALLEHARKTKNIELAEWTMITGLVVEDGRCVGVELLDQNYVQRTVYARAVLLASGGAGQVYSDTTNPAVATGDGISVAFSAGVELSDMEFYQFHPTALSLPGVPRFLMSEALRGEGAYLINDRGERFMERYHPLLELAPRDVVARAITREGFPEHATENSALRPVYLDLRHIEAEHPGLKLSARFPGISAFLEQHGLRLNRDLIPVRPAAHYLMGGIRTDVDTHTSMAGLYAAGEVACTGVHGANRLASNSLLEGLVFGARAAKAMRNEKQAGRRKVESVQLEPSAVRGIDDVTSKMQNAMWKHAGLLRDKALLASTPIGEPERNFFASTDRQNWDRRMHEAYSLFQLSRAIVDSALAREESRGAHYRSDFPKRNDARYGGRHSLLGPDGLSFVGQSEPALAI